MNQTPYFQITPDGAVNVAPERPTNGRANYSLKPVQVAVRRNPLGLEIHSANSSTAIDLAEVDALDIAMMLVYGVREAAPAPSEFVEVAP
jgi:hypothetical protein